MGFLLHRRSRLARRSLLACATLPLVARAACSAEAETSRQAAALKAASFWDNNNMPRRLEELTRPLVLINLWAHWCAGCLAEMPSFLAVARALGTDKIDVVLLSHPLSWPGDLRRANEAAFTFPLWRLAPNTPDAVVADTFRVRDNRFALPQTLLFAGPTRRLVHAGEGTEDWTAPTRMARLRSWLTDTL
jgi:thiol-disulfide isomerase/thioredoxin